ncbi:hypothetical protein TNCV_3238871 [Trichonephila clavipes]|nr:hypothetical protein TNCV_3238871 [Trichonephila clavipes]
MASSLEILLMLNEALKLGNKKITSVRMAQAFLSRPDKRGRQSLQRSAVHWRKHSYQILCPKWQDCEYRSLLRMSTSSLQLRDAIRKNLLEE